MLAHLVEDEGVCVSICEAGEVNSVESLKIIESLLLLILAAEKGVALVERAQERQVLDHGGEVGGEHLLLQCQPHPGSAVPDLGLDLVDGGHIVHDSKDVLVALLAPWTWR